MDYEGKLYCRDCETRFEYNGNTYIEWLPTQKEEKCCECDNGERIVLSGRLRKHIPCFCPCHKPVEFPNQNVRIKSDGSVTCRSADTPVDRRYATYEEYDALRYLFNAFKNLDAARQEEEKEWKKELLYYLSGFMFIKKNPCAKMGLEDLRKKFL